jgi:hypothetical protein
MLISGRRAVGAPEREHAQANRFRLHAPGKPGFPDESAN